MTRQEANKEILTILDDLITKHPDLRFGQIISNWVFPKGGDPFYEESELTLLALQAALKLKKS